MLKILSSEVSGDSDINYMPVVKFEACLGVRGGSALKPNPHLWTDTNLSERGDWRVDDQYKKKYVSAR